MPAKPSFNFAVVLEAVRKRIRETSLRSTAREIGMTPSGLQLLVGGSKPQERTRRKLIDWYALRAAQSARNRSRISSDDVDAAVRLLVLYAREDGRETVRARRVAEILRRIEGESSTRN